MIYICIVYVLFFFFSSRRRHTRCSRDWSSDVCSSDLLSAHLGGRNIMERTSKAGLMAQDRVEEFTARARELVASGRGRELMLMPGWWYAISAESYLDRLTETPDGLALAPAIKGPTPDVHGGK